MRADRMSAAGAVILAAGGSSRLGKPKQLAGLNGETLLGRSVRVAAEAGLSPVVVVLGARAEEIAAGCGAQLSGALVVRNEGWGEGMASSIRTGVGALAENAAVEGVILMTCDQPAVSAEHLRRLAEESGGKVLASRYGGGPGIPAYFPRLRFAELLRLMGDTGARSLLGAAGAIELPGGELDVDTPAALLAARERFRSRSRAYGG